MTIMIGEVKEGCKVPLSDVSQRGIVVAVHFINIPREGGQLEDLGTRNGSSRRGGGGKGYQCGEGFIRIHDEKIFISFWLVV